MFIYITVKVLVPQSCPTLCDPMIVARQVPLSMGFPKQEYWSGLPSPPPEDLSNPGKPENTCSKSLFDLLRRNCKGTHLPSALESFCLFMSPGPTVLVK